MGRGLSPLQKTILQLAYHNRVAELRGQRGQDGADVQHAEIIATHYGWKTSYYSLHRRDGTRNYGGHNFSKAKIGTKRYQAAHAAVSRAANRLADRGLVTLVSGAQSRWAGVNLTDEGITQAQQL